MTCKYKGSCRNYRTDKCITCKNNLLHKLREDLNVSAREMSLAIGQNESYINRIENRKAFTSMRIYFCICEYLNVTPEEFFSKEIENPTKDKKLYHQIVRLKKPEKIAICSLIECMQK